MSYSRREQRGLAPAHMEQGGNCLSFCHPINVLTSVLLTGKSEPEGIRSLLSPAAVQEFKRMRSINLSLGVYPLFGFLVSF